MQFSLDERQRVFNRLAVAIRAGWPKSQHDTLNAGWLDDDIDYNVNFSVLGSLCRTISTSTGTVLPSETGWHIMIEAQAIRSDTVRDWSTDVFVWPNGMEFGFDELE